MMLDVTHDQAYNLNIEAGHHHLLLGWLIWTPGVLIRFHTDNQVEENLVNKNQGWEPIHQKYKANENTSRHNPKKKQKQTINKD